MTIDLISGRKLAAEAGKLEKMRFEPVWSKILENQENKKTIQGIFKRIDAYAADFQVCGVKSYVERERPCLLVFAV